MACIRSFKLLLVAILLNSSVVACAQESLFRTAPGSPITVDADPSLVALGDVDGDGDLDIIVAYAAEPSVGVLLGLGDGRFQIAPAASVSLPDEPNAIAVGDLDGDGLLDVAISSHDSYAVVVLAGDGAGGFSPRSQPLRMRSGDRPHTHGLRLADVNADSHLDVLTVNHDDGDVSVLLSDGTGRFSAAAGSPFSVAPSPYPLGVGDVNRDGHVDAAVPSTVRSEGTVSLLLGDGSGGFEEAQVTMRTRQPWFAAIGDINGDESDDLVVTHQERPEVSVLLSGGDAGPVEVSGSPFNFGATGWGVVIDDFDGDGNADLAAVAGSVVPVLVGDGTGSFRPATGSPFRIGRGAWSLAVGDVNGDGKADIVTANTESRDVSVLLAH